MSIEDGMRLFRSGDYASASEHFRQAVRDNRDYHEAWNALGICLSKLEEYVKADACFLLALELCPDNATYQKNKAGNEKKIPGRVESSHSEVTKKPATVTTYLDECSVNLKVQTPSKTPDTTQSSDEEKVPKYKRPDNTDQAYNIIYDGLETGKTIMQITQELDNETHIGLYEAKKIATNTIIEAARKTEIDTFLSSGVEMYKWVSIVDAGTCETCIALNGTIFHVDVLGDGLVNFDTGEFLSTALANLTTDKVIINKETGKHGPPIHDGCRCILIKLQTEQQINKCNKDTSS